MADITNLSTFLGDVADAIRTKKETTEQIPAADFDTEILSITTGVMTQEEYDRCDALADTVLGNTPLFTELEYIESTGVQYIDTGVVFAEAGGEVVLDFQYTDAQMDVYICGTNGVFEAGKSDKVWFYSESGFTYSQTADNYARTVATGINTGSNENNIFIFARNWSGMYRPCAMKFYSAQMYKDDVLVRDFIPVKDYENVVCLYDKVTETFYYNQGSDVFVAGGEV